jgi:hypothetical protein
MGVSSKAQNLDSASAEEKSDPGEPSVTAVGEPSIIKVAAPEITRGSVLAGRYQVEAVIGRGGSGIVLRAYDRVAQMAVAVKLLKPELAGDPKWIERFSRELRLARRIQHPNVCRVFDIFQADGHWFITMELAPGGTLRDQLGEKAQERSLEAKIADVRAVAAGLAAIHQAGIVHRDVKPDNFLRMEESRLVLSDFGLATNPTEASTVSIMVGTPSYMAPEVVMGQQATSQSDVWSLGVVLHELVFGVRPEWTRGVAGSFVVRKPALTLSAQERALVAFIEECLHTDPLARPENAVAAQVQCERVLTGKSLSTSRRSRRPRWLWPAIAALAAVGVGIGSGQWWRRASALTASDAGPAAQPGLSFRGVAQDWTKTTKIVASVEGRLHCMAWRKSDRLLEVVAGAPRKAFEVDVEAGKITPATLPEQVFAIGCPQHNKRGEVLFESLDENGRGQIMLASSEANIAAAKALTHGSEPLWLPSGDEFIYSADDSHAALFSVPVMTTDIVAEDGSDQGLLVGKAISDDGRRLALRYFDVGGKRHVVVHALPSLAVVRRNTIDRVMTDFTFVDGSNRLAFSTNDQNGEIVAQLDLESNEALQLGGIPGRDIAKLLPGIHQWAFAATKHTSDVWKIEGSQRTVNLTNDGQSYYPVLSPSGDLIVEHHELDGRAVIRLYQSGVAPRNVSQGPHDYTPSFLPDGRGWLYVDGARRAIRKCSFDGSCQDVAAPGDFPYSPVASPSGEQIAYVNAVDRELLKVIRSDGHVRALGPARSSCRPFWTNENRIWVVQGTDSSLVWAELDSNTGERVRTAPLNEKLSYELSGCGLRSAPPGISPPPIAAWASEVSDIRVLTH